MGGDVDDAKTGLSVIAIVTCLLLAVTIVCNVILDNGEEEGSGGEGGVVAGGAG